MILSFLISFILKLSDDFELSKYVTMKNMKMTMKNMSIETARMILKERMTPERMSPVSAPSPEKILLRERRSAYSDGSALFMIYEREVTSLSSFMIPYKDTATSRRRILRPEPKNSAMIEPEPMSKALAKNIKYKNITDTASIQLAEMTKSILGVIYFCSTQTGLSARKAMKFPIPRKIHTSSTDSRRNPKKKTSVK